MRNVSLVKALVSAVVILAAGFCWVGPTASAQEEGKDQDKNGVVLKTPAGGFEASGNLRASQTGLPVYPGAKPMAETDKDSGNLTFSLSREGKPDVHFLVAKLETHDSAELVREYYKKKLGNRVTKFVDKDKDGNTVFEMKESETSGKFVQIKSLSEKTEIDLVRLEGVKFSDGIDIQ
ncbi:MAG TPA: hypothetical protein VMT20_08060 [Terriglobia bacterium]|nr:hypothetical protein [Terriglobia bacterium]